MSDENGACLGGVFIGVFISLVVIGSYGSYLNEEISLSNYSEIAKMVKEFPELQDNVDAVKINHSFIDYRNYFIIEQKFTEMKHEKEVKAITDPNITIYRVSPE